MMRNNFIRDVSPPAEMPYSSPADTQMHRMSNLMDAKLADVHAKLENNMEMLRRVLVLLERRFGSGA